jgi:hypothetical protein
MPDVVHRRGTARSIQVAPPLLVVEVRALGADDARIPAVEVTQESPAPSCVQSRPPQRFHGPAFLYSRLASPPTLVNQQAGQCVSLLGCARADRAQGLCGTTPRWWASASAGTLLPYFGTYPGYSP